MTTDKMEPLQTIIVTSFDFKINEYISMVDCVLNIDITINGKKPEELMGDGDYSFSILNFRRTIFETGNFFIFTCSCGDPECGGWSHGIIVKKDKTTNEISWYVDEIEKPTVFIFPWSLYEQFDIRLYNILKQIHKKWYEIGKRASASGLQYILDVYPRE